MRLDKLLSNLKYGTRTEIKKMIKNKLVKVNGEVVRDSSLHIDEYHDVVLVNEQQVHYQKFVYLMLNKPKDYISATTDDYHKTVIDLLDDRFRVYDVYPCGRLDIDTEGLLILSNDGQFAHQLMHPKKEVYKTYHVQVDKAFLPSDIISFKEGLEIFDGNNNKYQTKKALLEILDDKNAYISISEGKFHQVKRMFQKVGKKVLYLKRVQIGKLVLDENLKLGEYKELTNDDKLKLFINEYKLEEF